MHTDDDLSEFVGGQLLEVDVRPWDTKDEEGDYHETQLLLVRTSKGQFTIVTHNEHSGYYGGFCIAATVLPGSGS